MRGPVNRSKADALNDLREALGSYAAYCDSVEAGTLLVNADDDPGDVIVAAEMNVAECLRVCKSLGLTDDEIEAAGV